MSRTINCDRCGTVRYDSEDNCKVCDSLEIQNFREALSLVEKLNPKSLEDELNVERLKQIFNDSIEHFEENLDRMYQQSEAVHFGPSEIDF